MSNKNISDFFATQKNRYTKCLDPTMSCKNDSIKAHSVQHSKVLEAIEENGHVYELGMQVKDGYPKCSFRLVASRTASTFTGLCEAHDGHIFRPIDTKPLSIDDRQQLFLIAYRSVTRELHAAFEGAMRIQMTYQRLADQSRVPADQPSEAGKEAVDHMLKAWGVWKYRSKFFDEEFAKGKFESLSHSIFKFENEAPVLAASSFFSADSKSWGEEFSAVILNVIPTSKSETTVIFSYARKRSGKVRRYIAPVILAQGRRRKYELSYLLIDRAENFFVSPRAVNSWSDNKKKLIEGAYLSSIHSNSTPKFPDLMLF